MWWILSLPCSHHSNGGIFVIATKAVSGEFFLLTRPVRVEEDKK
jgi:hypothetical protein